MFKKVTIRNFQSHKKSILELSEGVNIIVGQTDSGKSAIIRALRWLIWNQPLGDSFRSSWGGSTKVTVVDFEDNEIERVEGDERLYVLNKSEFRAFRTDVPAEIRQVLNMTDVNLQQQLDSVFLLSQTAGEVAKHFNKVANLEKIALSQANIKKWIGQLNATITFSESQLKKDLEQLQQFNDLDKYESDIEVLEDIEKQCKQTQNLIKTLSSLIEQIEEQEQEIEIEQKVAALKPLMDALFAVKEKEKQCKNDVTELQSLIDELEECIDTIDLQKNLILLKDSVDTVLVNISACREMRKQNTALKGIISEFEQTDRLISVKQKACNEKQVMFESEMGDVCILCGSLLTR